jgi:putative ABC transport system permease protein
VSARLSLPVLLRRHLSAHPAGGVAVAALVIVLATVATVAPRATMSLHTSALRADLSALSADERDITGNLLGYPEFGGGNGSLPTDADAVWGSFDDSVEQLRDAMPAPLSDSVSAAQYVLATDGLPIDYAGSGPHTALSFGFDPRSTEHVRYTDGAAPAAAASGAGSESNPIEIGLATASATAMAWKVGEERSVVLSADASVAVRLSGIYEPVDADDGYWSHAPLLLTPSVFDDGLSPPIYTGTGLVDPSSLAAVSQIPTPARLSTWFPFASDVIDSSDSTIVLAQLREFEAQPPTVGITRAGGRFEPLSFTAGAADTIDGSLQRSAATNAVLATIASGPLGVMLAVLVLGCRVVSLRRTDAVRLLAARGASAAFLRSLLAIEGLVIGVPAAIIGILIGSIAVPGDADALWLILPALIGLTPAILLGLSATRAAARAERTDLGSPARSRVRLIVELCLLGLTIVATAALLQRGATTAAASSGIDLLLVAVPLLLALSACVIALRLYPLPLRWIARSAKRSRGLGSMLGAARALRDPAAGLAPVLALVVGVAVSVSSGVLLATLQTGIAATADAAVGADLRVSGPPLTSEQVDRIAEIPGVAAAATASGAESALITSQGRRLNTAVIVIDAADMAKVQAGSATALPVDGLTGGTDDGVPVIASDAVADRLGSDATLTGTPIRIVGTTEGVTPLSARGNWVIVDSANAEELIGAPLATRTVLIRLSDGADAAAVTTAVAGIAGDSAVIDTPGAVRERLEAAPATAGLRTALLVAIALTALLSALAVAMTLVLGTPARGRLLAVLRTLGGGRRLAGTLTAWEIGPPAVSALVVGAALGILLPVVILAGVDLRGFTAGAHQPALAIDGMLTLALCLGFAAVTALCTVAALEVSRRAQAATILRSVEEG